MTGDSNFYSFCDLKTAAPTAGTKKDVRWALMERQQLYLEQVYVAHLALKEEVVDGL